MLIGCGDLSNNVNKEFNREGETLLISVITEKSDNGMKSRVWKYEEGIHGQALYSPDDNKCEIVIYEPKSVDDKYALTLGHELMHCLYGDYHK